MTVEFAILLGAAVITAWAARVTLTSRLPLWASLPALALYLFLGIHTVLLAGLAGDGRIVPGYQLSPEVRNVFGYEHARGALPSPHPGYSWLVILAHVLVVSRNPDRAAFLRPLPATLFYIAVFWVFQARAELPPTAYIRSPGPQQNAYLTLAAHGDGVRLVFATGDGTFVPVLHVHEMDKLPPAVRLLWTRDGRALVVCARDQRLFAVDLDGTVAGILPGKAADWPAERGAFESVAVRRRLSAARREVAEFVVNHGGLHVE
jgi:hypothetical protein